MPLSLVSSETSPARRAVLFLPSNQAAILFADFIHPTHLEQVLVQLAQAGIRSVVACGLAESLTTQIPPGQIVLAEAALDPSEPRPELPHHRLFGDLRATAARLCISIRRARLLAADPNDPDYVNQLDRRREFGVEAVHPAVSLFYDACRRLGLAGAFACSIVPNRREPSTQGPGLADRMPTELLELVKETFKIQVTIN